MHAPEREQARAHASTDTHTHTHTHTHTQLLVGIGMMVEDEALGSVFGKQTLIFTGKWRQTTRKVLAQPLVL